jgi:hypothetical protein
MMIDSTTDGSLAVYPITSRMLCAGFLIPPKRSILAGIGTEAFVATRSSTAQELAATVGRQGSVRGE